MVEEDAEYGSYTYNGTKIVLKNSYTFVYSNGKWTSSSFTPTKSHPYVITLK